MADINEFLLNQLGKLDSKLDDIKDQGIKNSAFLDSHEEKDQELRGDVKKLNVSMERQSELLGEYNQSLKEHMKRTALLESRLDPIEKTFIETTVVAKYKKERNKRLVTIIATITSLLAGLAGLVEYFK